MKFYIDKNAEVLHEDVLINVALWCYKLVAKNL